MVTFFLPSLFFYFNLRIKLDWSFHIPKDQKLPIKEKKLFVTGEGISLMGLHSLINYILLQNMQAGGVVGLL